MIGIVTSAHLSAGSIAIVAKIARIAKIGEGPGTKSEKIWQETAVFQLPNYQLTQLPTFLNYQLSQFPNL